MKSLLEIPPLSFTKTTLPNGLDVIVRRQGDLPIVAMNLWYHVGSKNEERRQRGFAHLFEHLMFEGSEHFPGDFFKPLQRLGASINGSTSSDRTNYFVDLPVAHLELALAMESDRMAGFLPALSDEKIRIQKDVVKNEYRQNYANRPYGQAGRILAEAMYPPDHPYSWMTIGVMEDVDSASRADVEAFFQRFYVPSNASLAIVGDIDIDRASELAMRYFGNIPGGTRSIRPRTPKRENAESIELNYFDRVELDRLYLLWPSVPMFAEDDAALAMLSDILTRGKSSRLYQKLVVETGLAQDASSYQSGRELAGNFGATITLRPGKSWQEARDMLDAEIRTIVRTGVSADELSRVQNGRLAGFIYALDNVGGFGGVADRLNAYNIYLGDPDRITTDLKRYQDVTIDRVREVAKKYLLDHPRVSLTVRRKATQTSLPPLDRSVAPVSAPSVPFRAPKPEVIRLNAGPELWVIPRRDLPIVAMSCVMRAGAGVHSPAQGGLASLTADLLDEGTTTRTSQQIASLAENLGTHISSSARWDGCYVGMQCLTPHLTTSLDLALDVLRNPCFPEADFDRIKGQTLAALQADRENADSRAYRAFLSVLYPESHPYHLNSEGTETTVAGLSREALVAFHQRFYGPGQAAFVFAGDVDPSDLAKRLDEGLKGWTGGLEVPVVPPEVARSTRPRLILVDRPGAAQAVVRVGDVGVPRHIPDYEHLIVFNQILGGQFSSRLNTKLREEKGFTYGIRSGFDFRRGAGPFSISASLQADKIDEALVDLRHELQALFEYRPPSEQELHDARRALIEGQAKHFETPSVLASRYAALFLHGLPVDHYANFAERLEAVTIDTMLAAARRHIDPANLVAVVVADVESVRPKLEAIGWAPEVELLD